MFISIDGIDGAGKSTQLKFIRDWLKTKQIRAIFTREPGGTELGEKLRALLLDKNSRISLETETLLMFAARQQHIQDVILPALKEGLWVISDRFTDATFAYQGGGRGLDSHKITLLENWVQGDLRPDMTIILDVPLEVSLERLNRSRNKDRFELEPVMFFSKVRAAYLQRAQNHPHDYKIINTNREITQVQKEITAVLEQCCLHFKERQ